MIANFRNAMKQQKYFLHHIICKIDHILLLQIKLKFRYHKYTSEGNIHFSVMCSGACPGIRKRGGPKSESFFFFFFFAFQFFRGGGPAQKIAEKMIFSTKK